MSSKLQKFPIANARTGFNESLEPWLLPRDGFQYMLNTHLYRGVVENIPGYSLYTRMSYRRVLVLSPAPDGVTKTFTGTLAAYPTSSNFYGFGTINAGISAETFVFQMDDALPDIVDLVGSASTAGTIDLTTLGVSVTFNTAPPSISSGGTEYNAVFFLYDDPPTTYTDIMGIKPYFGQNNLQEIMVFDTRRMGVVNAINSGYIGTELALDNAVSEVPHQVQTAVTPAPAFNGAIMTFTGSLASYVTPGSLTFKRFNAAGTTQETFTDTGFNTLTSDAAGTGFINYTTGEWELTFAAGPAADNTLNAYYTTLGDLFTGNYTNFFSVANMEEFAFITNNVDAIRYYDGTALYYLNTNLSMKDDNVITYDITKCLHVAPNASRLLLIAPTVSGTLRANTIYFSRALNARIFTDGEFERATTSQNIRAFSFINTDMVVRFSNSEAVFRYTGDAFSPFRFDFTNNLWRCDASYSTINYDSYFTTVGKPAIVASNAVNVKRADEIIPDFTVSARIDQQTPVPYIDQTSIGQCYGERYDDFKEGWLCYVSEPSTNGDINHSDHVLAFNYLDQTYTIYNFPFTCLGYGRIISLPTWSTIYEEWDSLNDTWDSFLLEQNALIDLAGDRYGNVFELGTSTVFGAQKNGTITGVSAASPAVITSAGHDIQTGDRVTIQDVLGPTVINNQDLVATYLTANTFSVPVDTTLEPAYDSGGTWFTTPVTFDCITKDFNPFIEDGQLAIFVYIDILVSANDSTSLRVQFYKDNEITQTLDTYYQETTLTFSATTANTTLPQTKVWKRIYVSSVGKSHTIRFYQNLADFSSDNLNQPVKLHAFVLYMKPGGRIFN